MFENHVIKKSADLKKLPRSSKEPEKESRDIDKAEERVKLPPKPQPGIHPAQPGIRPAQPGDKKSTVNKDEDMEKGFLTHLKSRGILPKDKAGLASHAAEMAHHRDWMRESKKITEPSKQKDAGEGLQTLTKAMCPVMKGLQKLLKGLGGDIDKAAMRHTPPRIENQKTSSGVKSLHKTRGNTSSDGEPT